MTEIPKNSLDTAQTPAQVFLDHPDDKAADLLGFGRTTRAATPGAVIFSGHKITIPPENRLKREQGYDLAKELSCQNPPLHRKSSALSVIQAKAFPFQMFAQNVVFGL